MHLSYLNQVDRALSEVEDISLVWKDGLMNHGGPHRRLAGTFSPISIGSDECEVFHKIIEKFKPENCYIIGNAFGFSSAFIALAMEKNGGRSVITLDSQTEGDGERCAAAAENLSAKLGLSILKNKKGFSPQDIPSTADDEKYDMVFIDGLHSHPQVTKDFLGILPFTDDSTIFVWHDFWIRGIPECVQEAVKRNYTCLWLATSCEMVVGVKDKVTCENLQEIFPEAKKPENFPKHSSLLIWWVAFRLGISTWTERILSGRRKKLTNSIH